MAAYLSKISLDAGCILRSSVTQCPFIMYLLHLASYNILKKGGLEKPYIYKPTEISVWNLRVENKWYDSVKHRIGDFFGGTGFQYLWVGAEKTRETCGIVVFPEKVELLEYSHWYRNRLPDGTICFQEEIIPEFIREVQGYYTEINRLPAAKAEWNLDEDKKELWCTFLNMQCLNIAEEDLWNHLRNTGLSKNQAYYWSDLISKGQLRNHLSSFWQSGKIFDEYFVGILCSVSFLPSKWYVMERFYEMKNLLCRNF